MSTSVETARCAFQGALGAFSHQAGELCLQDKMAAGKVEFVPCQSFADVFEAVQEGRCEYGIVPLENSSIGSIVANYDLLWSSDVTLVSEVSMPVHHNLIGLKGASIEGIKEVLSHPAALDQCRKFLSGMPGVKATAFFDTSGAVFYVKESDNPSLAAIASEFAARYYGLEVLAGNVEDYPYNCTRFGVIAARRAPIEHPEGLPVPPYKVSCAAELTHTPGSLARLLTRIAGLKVNLTKIESRPIPDKPWHYRFFIDMELNGGDQDRDLIRVLKDSTETYKLLGRYRRWQEVGP